MQKYKKVMKKKHNGQKFFLKKNNIEDDFDIFL